MNTLDAFAADWLAWAWRAGLVSLVVLGALFAMRPLVERRASAHTRSWWWLAPLVPLVVPPLALGWPAVWPKLGVPPAPTALVARNDPGRSAAVEPIVVPELTHDTATGSGSTSRAPGFARGTEIVANNTTRLAPTTWLALLWWLTSFALLVRYVLAQRAVVKLLQRALPVRDSDLARRFAALARRAGVARVQLLLVEGAGSPATLGVFTPRIVVPRATLAHLSGEELDWVLLHELTHVRRRDLLVEALVQVVRIAWPLHPSAWIAVRNVRRERELACDEAALARFAQVASRRAERPVPLAHYGPTAARALLAVVELSLPLSTRPSGALHLVHPPSLERVRIMKLLHPDRFAATGLSQFGAAALVALTLGVGAFAATAQQDAPKAEPVERVILNVAPIGQPNSGAVAAETKRTLVGALRTLIAAQNADGSWSANAAGQGPRGRFDGAGEFDDTGVTGVVLLALIDAPSDVDIPGRREAIARALAHLTSVQDPKSGSFSTVNGNVYALPSHALATTAFVRVSLRIDPSPEAAWRNTAQHAVNFISTTRNPYQGWRYSIPPNGDNDSIVTSWMLLALAEARTAGLEVANEDVRGGLDFLAEMTDTATGRSGYQSRGVVGSRLADKAATHPIDLVELETAIVLCARFAWADFELRAVGASALADPLTSAALVAMKPPRWNVEEGSIDLYAWAFGTRAVRPLGGALVERWNAKLADALLAGVQRDSEGHASWPPIDAWHVEGQGVAMTAWCALALEAAR